MKPPEPTMSSTPESRKESERPQRRERTLSEEASKRVASEEYQAAVERVSRATDSEIDRALTIRQHG